MTGMKYLYSLALNTGAGVEYSRNDGSADKLRKHTDEEQEPETIKHIFGLEKGLIIPPSAAPSFNLEADTFLDLLALELNKCRVGITITMVLDQHLPALFGFVVSEKPPRTLRHEESDRQDDDRRDCLNDHGDSPRPVCANKTGSIGNPCTGCEDS
jgi:hypothetical protein